MKKSTIKAMVNATFAFMACGLTEKQAIKKVLRILHKTTKKCIKESERKEI